MRSGIVLLTCLIVRGLGPADHVVFACNCRIASSRTLSITRPTSRGSANCCVHHGDQAEKLPALQRVVSWFWWFPALDGHRLQGCVAHLGLEQPRAGIGQWVCTPLPTVSLGHARLGCCSPLRLSVHSATPVIFPIRSPCPSPCPLPRPTHHLSVFICKPTDKTTFPRAEASCCGLSMAISKPSKTPALHHSLSRPMIGRSGLIMPKPRRLPSSTPATARCAPSLRSEIRGFP